MDSLRRSASTCPECSQCAAELEEGFQGNGLTHFEAAFAKSSILNWFAAWICPHLRKAPHRPIGLWGLGRSDDPRWLIAVPAFHDNVGQTRLGGESAADTDPNTLMKFHPDLIFRERFLARWEPHSYFCA
jgi:hypothetical protein